MDFKLAIEINRAPLLLHVLALFARIGLAEGITIDRLSRPLYREVLGILRRIESATRRLIVAAARDIVLEPVETHPPKPRSKGAGKPKSDGEVKPRRKRRPVFNLFDALKRFGRRFKKKTRRAEPNVYSLESFLQRPGPAAAPVKKNPVDDGTVSAANLVRRLVACADALRDIPGQAMRLAQWRAKPKEERRPERWSPLRTGRPPGFRQRAKDEVDEILKACNWLALLGNPPLDDTS